MMYRVLCLILFCVACEAQRYDSLPASFEGWLRWQKQSLASLPKRQNLYNELLKFATTPDIIHILSDIKALLETAERANVSKACKNAVEFAGKNYKSKWSQNMLDAMAKPPPAVKQGAVHWVGGFQECMSDLRPDNWTGPGPAPRSHYCKQIYGVPYVNPLVPGGSISIDVGLCLPENCSAIDIDIFTYTLMFELGHLLNTSGTVIPNYAICYVRRDEMKLSTGAIVMIIICVVFGLLMAAGTIFDLLHQRRIKRELLRLTINGRSHDRTSNGSAGTPYVTMHEEEEDEEAQKAIQDTPISQPPTELGWWEKMLLAFSVYTNASKILDTKQEKNRLDCLDGIRFLSMSWVILGHTYFFIASTTNNLGIFYPVLTTWSYQAIMNATFSVDSFFVLSGLLTGYIFLREATKMGTLKKAKFWVLYFFHRFWRLTPPYMLFLGFYTTLLKYMANGPLWNQAYGMDEMNCEANWWYNLLYINNFIGAAKMCMGWSWYLANDMQFHYFVAPIILSLIFLFGILGAGVSALFFILISAISAGVLSSVYHVGVNMTGTGFDDIYIKPWCRVGAYVVGLVTAYAILEHKKGRFRLNKVIVALGWIFATAISLATLYGLTGVYHGDYTISEGVSALYNAMSRLTWAVGLSWLIFACICGYGGWINTFLSWKAFIPLSRLTYSAYLVHPVIMTIVYNGSLQAQMASEVSMVYFFFGNMVAAYLAAFALTLTWESPLIGLERILLKK